MNFGESIDAKSTHGNMDSINYIVSSYGELCCDQFLPPCVTRFEMDLYLVLSTKDFLSLKDTDDVRKDIVFVLRVFLCILPLV